MNAKKIAALAQQGVSQASATDQSIRHDARFMAALDGYMDAVTYDERNSDKRVACRKVIFDAADAWSVALARASLPAQGGQPYGWIQFVEGQQTQNFARDEDELNQMKEIAALFMKDGQSVEYVPVYAAPAQASDARDAVSWSKEPPTEQADYWNWDGDEDHAPMIYHVLWSGTAKKCFVSIGQYGIAEAIWCDNFGGYWMKIEQPSVRAAMSASQGNIGGAA